MTKKATKRAPTPSRARAKDEGTHEAVENERKLLLAQVREANERLVLTSLHLKDLAEDAARARAEREEIEARDAALREANRLKDEFLAMLGHELRNPLAPILTALEVMKMRGSSDSLREREVIERQVRHMVALVDDLMDVTRITSGKVLLSRAPVEIAVIVAKAIETASPILESRRHRFSVSVPETGLAVDGDANRLAQVFSNLLTNAAKYTDPGGTISLTARRDGGWAQIAIKDDGRGIPPAMLPVVFERFVQTPQTIDRAEGGLGLGLAIVESLVKRHGGEVFATSEGPGRGSEFVVRLPAIESAEVGPALPTARGRAATPYERVLQRVLVVDDNVDAAELLAEALGARHHEVAIAHDGPEALRTAERFEPDAIVLDIGLPVMDGYEVARRLRERECGDPRRRRVRLIALTGYGQPSDRQKSASVGMDVHLVKPVDFEALEAALVEPSRDVS